MQGFKISKKGYDPKEVDKYINNIENSNVMVINGYKSKIQILEDKIKEYEKSLKEYKEKEVLISSTLIEAVDKADNIVYASKIRFALESERLKIMQDSFDANINSLLNEFDDGYKDRVNEKFKSMEDEIQQLFNTNFLLTK